MVWTVAISTAAAYNTTTITTDLSCPTSLAPSTPNCWHLPSKTELQYLYEQKNVVGGFASAGYWSSTEYGSSNAWGQNFSFGDQNIGNKYRALRVRAVRAF